MHSKINVPKKVKATYIVWNGGSTIRTTIKLQIMRESKNYCSADYTMIMLCENILNAM
jgi:hypothetical protein